jgi:hypothetical protein
MKIQVEIEWDEIELCTCDVREVLRGGHLYIIREADTPRIYTLCPACLKKYEEKSCWSCSVKGCEMERDFKWASDYYNKPIACQNWQPAGGKVNLDIRCDTCGRDVAKCPGRTAPLFEDCKNWIPKADDPDLMSGPLPSKQPR